MPQGWITARRCNSCGHLWTGGTLDLPLEVPRKPTEQAKGESGTQEQEDYNFGDGWEPDVEGIPF